jgi:hypothetical protein
MPAFIMEADSSTETTLNTPSGIDLLPTEGQRLTNKMIRIELAKLGYNQSIPIKTTVPELKLLLDSLRNQLSEVDNTTIEVQQREVSAMQNTTIDQVYSTPSKAIASFTGVSPTNSVTAAYEILMNHNMILLGHSEVLQALLDVLQLHDITAMEYLVTIPEYMADISAHLSPIGKMIFMRACPSTISSPLRSPPASLRKVKLVKSDQMSAISDQIASLSDTVEKLLTAQSVSSVAAKVQEFKLEHSKRRVGVKSASNTPIHTLDVSSMALAQIDVEIAAFTAKRAALQASAAAAVLPPASRLQMEEKQARLTAIQADCVVLEAMGVSPGAPVSPPPSTRQQMIDTVAAASLPVPVAHTPATYDHHEVADDCCYDDGDDSGDDNKDEGDSGDESYNGSKARGKIPRAASSSILQRQAAKDIATLTDYWKYSIKTTYTDIMLAAESQLGLQIITVVGGVYAGQFKKSNRDSGKARALQSKEVYGPPDDIQPSKGGLSRDSGEGRIVFPRSYKECIKVLDTESNSLMSSKFLGMRHNRQWLSAFHEFKIMFTASALKLLGSTPDIPQPQGIQKSAGMCLFLFKRIQKACSAKDYTLLTLDFESGWEREVRPMVTAILDRDITMQEWEAMLAARGNVCPISTCGAAGMTQEVCGVCVKSASVKTGPPHNWLKKRDAARVLFDASHPTLTPEKGRTLFLQENPEFVWAGTGDTAGPSNRSDALRYIFANQQKIALPFSVA